MKRINDWKEIEDRLIARDKSGTEEQKSVVKAIIEAVKTEGDQALFAYTHRFDGFLQTEETIEVTPEEKREAYEQVEPEMLQIIKRCAANIREYHEMQKREGFILDRGNGEVLMQKILPVGSAGVYIPGGKAAYPSSVLMNVIPAKIAGVPNVYMASPADKEGKLAPMTIVAAMEAGVDRIFKMGGAQAVAAFAYGTESIPKVDKITGPGNIYVALAKREVFGTVGIDMIAGPSEILIIADESANPKYIAADLLSQAEHDELAASILITTSYELSLAVEKEIEKQVEKLEKKNIVAASLENHGTMIVTESLQEACKIANAIAPEHLELCVKEPEMLLNEIQNAGSVFLGQYTPEPVGDYYAGVNHVLPTNGTARFSSPLGVDDFTKSMSVTCFTKEALNNACADIIGFATKEGLGAHAYAAKARWEDEQ